MMIINNDDRYNDDDIPIILIKTYSYNAVHASDAR
jgi:hypothetical protein